jgi:catechol 2,3-dioxygenase-like lactoylglutathione lyase family enzyme
MYQPQADTATSILAIDHVALRVLDPDALAMFLCAHCGMQRTVGTEDVAVLAAPDGGTRLFLFEAAERPAPGVLERIVLRVSDLERALWLLPDDLPVEHPEPELSVFQGPEGLGLGFTSVLGGGIDYDIDHLVLRVMDADETAVALATLGFVPRGDAVHVGDKHVRLRSGIRSAGEDEPLSHIGVLVESVEAVRAQALRAGLETDHFTLPPNKLGVYVPGPERIRIEYADHAVKPGP